MRCATNILTRLPQLRLVLEPFKRSDSHAPPSIESLHLLAVGGAAVVPRAFPSWKYAVVSTEEPLPATVAVAAGLAAVTTSLPRVVRLPQPEARRLGLPAPAVYRTSSCPRP